MSDLARIYTFPPIQRPDVGPLEGNGVTSPHFPGVDTAPGDRPATYEEYLVSIGKSAGTVRNYVWRLNKAERILADLGATLLTADAFQLAAMAARMSDTHSLRGQLRCSLKHWYQWQDRMNAPLRAVRVPPQPQIVCKALEV